MRLFRIIWRKMAALSLSVWLLIISSLIMLLNSEVAVRHPQIYYALNTTSLWIWLDQTRHSNLLVFVAVIMLVVSLAALALNTLACTISRIVELSRFRGKKLGPRRAFLAWAPTLMHILFFLLLAGHMAAFSFGEWQHHTVRKGESLHFSPDFLPLTITSFSRTLRQGQGPLQNTTISHEVGLQIDGKSEVISEMQPLKLPNGHWLVFLAPQQKDKKGRVPVDAPVDCSGDERHAQAILFDPSQPIKLKQVFDPGVYFLFIGFGLILILLGLYYAIAWRSKAMR